MAMSDSTRKKVGINPKGADDQLASALGVVSLVESKIKFSKAEASLLESKALTVEDDPWNQLPNERRTNLIRPTYDPVLLVGLCSQNNTLAQCVEAMEVNIDGTGFDIERRDQKTPEENETDKTIKAIKDFFESAYINESFTSIRRALRRDLESMGSAYLELLRNGSGEITLLRYLDGKLVRKVKLDDPVVVEKSIIRNGKDETVKMLMPERRYAQMIGNKVRYFREYGSSRDVDANTGKWLNTKPKVAPSPKFKATQDEDKVEPDDAQNSNPEKPPVFQKSLDPTAQYSSSPRQDEDPTKTSEEARELGTEIIEFTVNPDITTPYGVPRWINQIPSVLGSRKAEELNLEYFESGGLPPVMLLINGGQLSPNSKAQLNSYLGGEAKTKMRAVIAEVFSTGGDLSSNSKVSTTVERFGSDQLQDAMFERYDHRCEASVRGAFRLPPLFVGGTQEYTFATAYASYLVAEAQVFKPEREAFDEIINNTVMRELAPDYVYRSLPMAVHDVAVQLQALTLVKDMADGMTFVDEVNEVAGLNITFKPPMLNPGNPMENPEGMDPFGTPGKNPFGPSSDQEQSADAFWEQFTGTKKKPDPDPKSLADQKSPAGKFNKVDVVKLDDGMLYRLAEDWASYLSGDKLFKEDSVHTMQQIIARMDTPIRKLFNGYVGMKMAPNATHDQEGVAELIACAGDCLGGS